MKCKKCENEGSVVLRQKDFYCENCFVANTNHKFRACIGKNKILTAYEKVLICLSGGGGSTVLLDLIYNGLTKDEHKKLRITPYFLHIIGIDDVSKEVSNQIKKQCNEYNFDLYLCHISSYLSDDINFDDDVNIDQEEDLKEKLNVFSPTTKNDLIQKIRRSLFIRCAKKLSCKTVFTAETTSTLASNLLSNLALGRGSQVENDMGFNDTRDDEIKILRPMKDISQEELTAYIELKNMIATTKRNEIVQEKSLQSIIQSFVENLQNNFEATISTVCKTADKIGVQLENRDLKCCLCQNPIIRTSGKLSALEATNISKLVSLEKPVEANEHLFRILDEKSASTTYPFINHQFCYSCRRSYLEKNDGTLFNVKSSNKS